jgi:hypothetical protein
MCAVAAAPWAGRRPSLGGLCHGDGGQTGGCPPPEGVDVAYPRERVAQTRGIHNGRGIFFPINVHGSVF